MATYLLTVTGTTYTGNTPTFTPTTQYVPTGSVNEPGVLVAFNPRDAAGATGTGVNILDILLTVGHRNDATRLAGETIWASNDALVDLAEGRPASSTGLDEVVQFSNGANFLRTVIQPGVARLTTDDFFFASNGAGAVPANIVEGEVVINWTTSDFLVVEGTASFYGVYGGQTFAEGLVFTGIFVA